MSARTWLTQKVRQWYFEEYAEASRANLVTAPALPPTWTFSASFSVTARVGEPPIESNRTNPT